MVALLKARAVSEKFSADVASRRGLTPAELLAVEAIHRAVEVKNVNLLIVSSFYIFKNDHFISSIRMFQNIYWK